MTWMIWAAVCVVLAALSTRFFLAAIMEGPVYVRSKNHNVMAIRVGRYYRIVSWGLITFFMLATLVQLFWQSANGFLN